MCLHHVERTHSEASGTLALRLPLLLLAAILISAAPPTAPDDLVRQGNQALEQGDYASAIVLYQQAEDRSADPGLIAFNKATAYYHLQDYRKAESHYRMALDDAAIGPERRARALYNIGDALVKLADESDVQRLRQAIRFFSLCLDMAPEEGLRRDAAHNLELTKLLWNKARARAADPPAPNESEPPDEARSPDTKKKEDSPRQEQPEENPDSKQKGDKQPQKADIDPKTKADKNSKVDPGADTKKMDLPRDAGPPVLPDTDELRRQSPEDTLKTLDAIEKRLHNERRRLRMDAAIPEKPSGRDW